MGSANYLLCCVVMGASVVFALIGFFLMVEEDGNCGRDLAIAGLLFMISQSFSVAKVSRDHKMATEAEVAPHSTTGGAYGFMKPTKTHILGQILPLSREPHNYSTFLACVRAPWNIACWCGRHSPWLCVLLWA